MQSMQPMLHPLQHNAPTVYVEPVPPVLPVFAPSLRTAPSTRTLKTVALLLVSLTCIAAASLGFIRLAMQAHHQIPIHSLHYYLLVDSDIKSIAQNLNALSVNPHSNSAPTFTFSTVPQDGTQASVDSVTLSAPNLTALLPSIHLQLLALGYQADSDPCKGNCQPASTEPQTTKASFNSAHSHWTRASTRSTIELDIDSKHSTLDITKFELH